MAVSAVMPFTNQPGQLLCFGGLSAKPARSVSFDCPMNAVDINPCSVPSSLICPSFILHGTVTDLLVQFFIRIRVTFESTIWENNESLSNSTGSNKKSLSVAATLIECIGILAIVFGAITIEFLVWIGC